jgi:hypothetical protein
MCHRMQEMMGEEDGGEQGEARSESHNVQIGKKAWDETIVAQCMFHPVSRHWKHRPNVSSG